MRIGVIEAGKVGGGLGKIWVRAGHQVLFSSRHPNKLKVLIEQAGPGAHAGTVSLPGSTTAGEELAKKLPNALVVKAFSTFPASFIPHAFYRPVELQRLVVFYCGDHRLSKAAVHQLIADSNFVGLDAGPLRLAREFEAPGRLHGAGLVGIAEARRLLKRIRPEIRVG